jgi:putative serine protease PepD
MSEHQAYPDDGSPSGSQPSGSQPSDSQPSATGRVGDAGQYPTEQIPTNAPPPSSSWAQRVPYPPAAGDPIPTAGPTLPWTPANDRRGPGVRRATVATVAAAAIALAAGGVGGFVGYALHGQSSPLQTIQSQPQGQAAPVVDRSSLAQIAAKVQPTVVVIQTPSGEGSGVIMSADGYIVTNNHVVSGARGNTVSVTFNSGKKVDGTIVGTDPRTDLAVVKVQGVTGLTAATWGNSDDVQVGDTVLAIGSPLGLQGSVTAGIVSALHRTITVGDDQRGPFSSGGSSTTIGDAIQTDAPINPGNSGGALVDTNGQVIGINSAIATSGSSGNIGVGFAISSNKAKAVTEQLINGGKVSHPYLGVRMSDAASGGAQVESIESGSPASKSDLKVGDVVTKIDGRAVAGSEDVVAVVQSGKVGQQLQLTVVRSGSEISVTVTLGEAPS